MDDVITELTTYAELEGSEWSSTVWALINMYQMRTLISPRLEAALEKELLEWLIEVKKNTTIVEETIIPTSYTVKTLEWNT